MRVGVLGTENAFLAHSKILSRYNVEVTNIVIETDFQIIDGLVISIDDLFFFNNPLYNFEGLAGLIIKSIEKNLPIFTISIGCLWFACKADIIKKPLQLINAEACMSPKSVEIKEEIAIPILGKTLYTSVNKNGIYFTSIAPNIGIMSQTSHGKTVLLRQGNILAAAFQPELTTDARLHKYFIQMVREHINLKK